MLREKDESPVIHTTEADNLTDLVKKHLFERHHRATFRHFVGKDAQLLSAYKVEFRDSMLNLLPNNTYELILSAKLVISDPPLNGYVVREIAMIEALKTYEAGKILVIDETMERLGLHSKTHYCNSIVDAIKLATQHRNIKYEFSADSTEVTFFVQTGIGEVTYRLHFYTAVKEPIAIIGRIIKQISDRYSETLAKD